MARAINQLNNYQAEQLRQFNELKMNVDDLAKCNPSDMSDAQRQAVMNVLRSILERFSASDALSNTLSGLSAGAIEILRILKGSNPGDYEYPSVWQAPFSSEEDAMDAAHELERQGLIEIFTPPRRTSGASAITLTGRGERALN